MSTKNKKSVASQALLEMDTITSALKEESKKSLNILLAEAVKNALREGCDEINCDEEKDDDDYEVIDNEKKGSAGKEKKSPKKSEDEAMNPNDMEDPQAGADAGMQQTGGENPQMGGQQAPGAEGPDAGAQEMPQGDEMGAEGDAGEGDEGWGEFSDYKVDDNTYDLTGENDYDTVVKVYKLLNGDDQVVVKKDDNKLQLKDNEAGTEYVIDLGGGDSETESEPNDMEGGEMPNNLNEEFEDYDDLAGFPEEYPDDEFNEDEFGDEYPEEDEFDDEFGDEGYDFGEDEMDPDYDGVPQFHDHNDYPDWDGDEDSFDDELYEGKGNNKNKKNRKPMKESKEVLFEVDLGYTDNYQDKDPIAGLSNNEPAKGKKSWHKGVPTGTAKPWAGQSKTKSDPFKTQVDECGMTPDGLAAGAEGGDEAMEEQTNVGGFVQQNSVTTTHTSDASGRKARSMRGNKTTGSADPRYSSATNESKQLRAIKKENKELKEAVVELRKSLNEAYITNVNLGKITKLFLENATSQSEKIEIVNRFANEAKTLEQSKMLYESINKELKKNNKGNLNLNESSVTANGTKVLNEEKVYKSPDLLKTIDFMNRVLSC